MKMNKILGMALGLSLTLSVGAKSISIGSLQGLTGSLGLSLLAQEKGIDFVGASNVEFNAVGEVQGSYQQKLIVNGKFEKVGGH
ncbi:hypothetical protein MNB_SUP05-SYMBIONT-5-959 [hydrothermal vent metagenome]|uniref:Uncharacterized protein n=1 Tax=hydrothermal vent metagenome TaxID=652676 RepID=A0A1W1E130_9ZZZZ